MTCIVGLVDNGTVYMGGDSAGVEGYNITERKDSKVFTNGEFIMGFTSSFRMGQLLRYKFKPPKRSSKKGIMRYMVTDFVDSVRECFTEGGYAGSDSKGREEGGRWLVGYKSRLFEIDSDYQVGEGVLKYESIGVGNEYALGSMYTSEDWDSPEARVKTALKAACKFNGGVTKPLRIVKL